MNMKKLAMIGYSRFHQLDENWDGQLDNLSGLAYALLGFGILAGVGILVVAKFSNLTDTGGSLENSDAHSFLGQVIDAYKTMGDFLGIIVIVLVAVVIVGVTRLFGRQ